VWKLGSGNLGSHVEVTRVVTGIQNRPELVSNYFMSVTRHYTP